jgi:putative hydrolase of the HAD superfamily
LRIKWRFPRRAFHADVDSSEESASLRFRHVLSEIPFEAWSQRFLALDARGSVHKSVVYPALVEEFGADASVATALLDDYVDGCCRHAVAFEGMKDTLSALRKRGKRLGILTNGETLFQSRHIDALCLGDLVDEILISQAEGLRKPEAQLFHRAAARLAIKPSDCLFVGDNPSADILGAHAAGLQTAWFRCGQVWPAHLEPNPGPTIGCLPELLDFAL